MRKLLFLLVFFCSQAVLADPMKVTIDYIGPTDGTLWMGVKQGLSEANLQGQFLGQKYIVKPITVDHLDKLKSATALLVGIKDPAKILKIAQAKQLANVAVFNLGSDAGSLRSTCQSNLFNIPPSQQMKLDAVAQWEKKHPGTKVEAHSWNENFKKFAASQLNHRFTKSFGVKMDGDAWAGWAGVKLISDSIARMQSADSAKLLNYLKKDIDFDAQKGDGATFRDTGQLRQIVLLVNDKNKIVAEAPLHGVKGGLDSLGLTSCKK